jgi:hypothetical protein
MPRGVGWTPQGDPLTPQLIRTLVGLNESDENLHQSRLSGAVFADQTDYFIPVNGEIYLVQCDDTRIGLRDPPQLEHGFFCRPARLVSQGH